MGTIFLVFGLNGFFNFLTMPPMPEEAGNFLTALGATGYFFPFLKACEVLAGVLLIIGTFVPFALVLLTPIVANILLFHIFLAPAGLYVPVVVTLCLLYLGLISEEYSSICKNIFRCPLLENRNKQKPHPPISVTSQKAS